MSKISEELAELKINPSRLRSWVDEISTIGKNSSGGSGRLTLSIADKIARDLVSSWARELVDEIKFDHVGNTFFMHYGKNPQLPFLVTGSHLDTQKDGGHYDGVYGVLAGLEVLATLKDNNIKLSSYENEIGGIAVVNWTNEEEVRFCPAMGSAVFSGSLVAKKVHESIGIDGTCFRDELKKTGYLGYQFKLPIKAFIETHIEQGPVLEAEEIDIGVVTGAQGQVSMELVFSGSADHSGTTPMHLRKDAFMAAAETMTVLKHAVAKEKRGVLTAGEVTLYPNSRTTIPAEVKIAVDLRHPDKEQLMHFKESLVKEGERISDEHHCKFLFTELSQKLPIDFSQDLIDVIADSARKNSYSYKLMYSGATHDSCNIARIAPTAMIFIPCRDGISHNPKEFASTDSMGKGANVLLHTLLGLVK